MDLLKNRNVFLFGAGVSHDAGIPLLGGFMDRLIEIAMRKRSKGNKLSASDKDIFDEAVKVRESLDQYHGRAAFDDRNIEDILSILALGANSGRRYEQQKFNYFVRAIARTIDLECEIQPAALNVMQQPSGHSVYGRFWKAVIDKTTRSGDAPTIISLNYDLVLERALVSAIAGNHWKPFDRPFPYGALRISYYCDSVPDQVFTIERAQFSTRGNEWQVTDGYKLVPIAAENVSGKEEVLNITILKPHGSLNFPKRQVEESYNFQHAQESPILMPPIFNKSGDKALYAVWAQALDALRSAVNVVICGYSLPKTDMYMQFFLKAALGPNKDLSRIIVFDPALFRQDASAKAMKERYSDVFSEQIRSRINFNPSLASGPDGTFERMVKAAEVNPENLLFLE